MEQLVWWLPRNQKPGSWMIIEVHRELKCHHKAWQQVVTVSSFVSQCYSVFHSLMASTPLQEDGLKNQSVPDYRYLWDSFFLAYEEGKITWPWIVTPCTVGMQLAMRVLWYCHTWHEHFIPLGTSPTGNYANSSPCPLIAGILSRRQTSLSTALVQWTGTGSEKLAFDVTFLPHLLICGDAAFSLPPVVYEGGMKVWCHNRLCCRCLLAESELLYFLEFGESKYRWQTGLNSVTSFSSS